MSNVKVTVEWEAPCVFAGDEVRCIITFKNSSPPAGRSRSLSPYVNGQNEPTRDRWKQDIRHQAVPRRAQSVRKADDRAVRPQARGHRPALSLSGATVSRESSRGPPISNEPSRPKGHGRSLSIVSMGSATAAATNNETKQSSTGGPPTRRYHNRAASLQILPARSGSGSLVLPSPRRATDLPFRRGHSSNTVGSVTQKHESFSSTMTPSNGRPRTDSRTSPNITNSPSDPPSRPLPARSATSNTIKASPTIPFSPPNQKDNYNSNFVSTNKVLSPMSNTATPRSSLELYSQSNHSTETLASEYVLAPKSTQTSKPGSRRGTYLTPIPSQVNKTEILMMGYVQLSGSFTLDGSLVNMSQFEAIKMKGVIGGQGGGGVVGVEKSRRESGILGSFGWGGIGQSLGGLIGNQEISSIKEMKGIANTKAIPIISTPHSILFVNLSLQPGESRSFSYTHRLPENLPPTYKGRVIKIEYQLTIGTQRPQQTSQPQSIRHAEFPFKVLSGVTPTGELPVYDLKSPHIILRDTASSQAIEADGSFHQRLSTITAKRRLDTDSHFASYVERLLNESSNSDGSLLSPSSTKTPMDAELRGGFSAKDVINHAILRGNTSSTTKGSTNRFDIHRGGQRVATIILARSAYRLGERLIAGVDLKEALLPCYAIHAFLETVEEVDESIALRSNASITRATRRIQSSCFENAVCAQRLSLEFMIPTTVAPDFRTSSIQLKWSLRIEFTMGAPQSGPYDDEGLLEEVNEDERGRVLSAAQELPCETFDVLVPITIYGGFGEVKEPPVMSATV